MNNDREKSFVECWADRVLDPPTILTLTFWNDPSIHCRLSGASVKLTFQDYESARSYLLEDGYERVSEKIFTFAEPGENNE